MKWLLPAILIIPAAEIILLLYSGTKIGIMPTILLLLITGIGGAYLAKRQGLKALLDLRDRMGTMEAPGNAVIDGVCIFIGGILLLLPGFISDVVGLLLLFKGPRKIIRPFIVSWIYKKMKQGRIVIR
ncbi:FxsA family protein [Sporosarcina sp. ACRSL]|uniref:FxsA family protein n=1 Tax=Sporosarcina sp. ACRSL TaxID=2918215 RepID=UPI001EF5DC31|nr:FxsA family protein [Sporosarcina sp. ACRSL]MCG7346036.1 FxsA family protein [Sporosarcina sp. ACRSL]